MNDILNYKGYEIVSRHNNKINARIKNNRYVSEIPGLLGANLEYESSITFRFHELRYDGKIHGRKSKIMPHIVEHFIIAIIIGAFYVINLNYIRAKFRELKFKIRKWRAK